jgi:hypothetical protein
MHSKYEVQILKHIYNHGRTHFNDLPVKDDKLRQDALYRLVECGALFACQVLRTGAAGNQFHAHDGTYDISDKNAAKQILNEYRQHCWEFGLQLSIGLVTLAVTILGVVLQLKS